MQEIATISFTDADSGEEAYIIVRATQGLISVCLSLEGNGDVEIAVEPNKGEILLQALQQAISTARDKL